MKQVSGSDPDASKYLEVLCENAKRKVGSDYPMSHRTPKPIRDHFHSVQDHHAGEFGGLVSGA